ncbi:MAG TPA: PadR family transcriptional regulator [Thermoplasmata archaeon]|nr:PadR family transcriptional regulator [Thermoplasmata archaeon]
MLRAIQQGASYGYQIHRLLRDTGLTVRLNHLYPILRRMEKEGLVTSSQVPGERGPMRHQYSITSPGRKFLDEELVRAIAVVRLAYLEHLASDETTFRRALDLLAKYLDHATPNGRTALVVPPGYLSEINFRWFLSQLFDVAQGDIYLVRPEGTFEIDEPRITVLDGSDTYIPLRDGHIDNLVLVWVPRPRRWQRPLEESTRVMKASGIVAIILPDALIERDVRLPINIGAFMEGARVRRTGDQVGEVALSKAIAFLEDRFRHVAVEPVPELSFHLLIAWGKRRPASG